MTNLEALVFARTLLSDPSRWIKGSLADTGSPEDPKAKRFCAVGSIQAIAHIAKQMDQTPIKHEGLVKLLNYFVPKLYPKQTTIMGVNDSIGREAVLHVFDFGIATLAEEEGVTEMNGVQLPTLDQLIQQATA